MDLVIVDPTQHVGKPSMRINVIELAGLCRKANYAERRRKAGSPSRQRPNGDGQRSA
jgi:hypothetical protein